MARIAPQLVILAGLMVACGASVPPPRTTSDPADAQPAAADAAVAAIGDAQRAQEPDAATADRAPGSDLAAVVDLATASDLPAATEGPAGCADPMGLPEGQATIAVDGANRTYIVHLPAGYTREKAWPLVLALHPNGGSGIGYWDATAGARSIRALAKDKAIVVLPLARPAGGGFDWRGNLPADLAFFEALLGRLENKLCVDTTRIFAMGFSGGGSFAGVLACRRRDIRAFASGSGVGYYDAKDCTVASAAWITVGADELIAARTAFRDDWVMRNKCQPTTSPTPPANCLAYACPKDAPVHFCVHPGGHLWPDYGTQAAWTFFQQF